MEYVYIFEAIGLNSYKIGQTKDIKARLATIRTFSPVKVRYVYASQVCNGLAIESQLHVYFKSCRKIGEWFSLTTDQVKEAITLLSLAHIDYLCEKDEAGCLEKETLKIGSLHVEKVSASKEVIDELVLLAKKHITENKQRWENFNLFDLRQISKFRNESSLKRNLRKEEVEQVVDQLRITGFVELTSEEGVFKLL